MDNEPRGFDFAVVESDGRVMVGETKWADGNLYECLWDMFKLASATTMPRVLGAVAIYGAPVKHWRNPVECAELFADRAIGSVELIDASARRWQTNLEGSTARPKTLPAQIQLRLLSSVDVDVFGNAWEIRVVSVTASGPDVSLSAGWPDAK